MKTKACALIKNGNQILILKRSSSDSDYPNLWDIPSGDVLPDETIKEALIREVKEETGLTIKASKFSSVWEEKYKEEYLLGIVFICSVLENSPTLSEEHEEFKWIFQEEISQYNFAYGINEALLESNLFL
ncbi:MAG: NUDIX domain-containing protein [Nanoarchaeota archaeon]